ncbi:MAG: hypothetical protein LBH13_03280 [Cellulomonadaceae bacterium]|jgi:hypothetical protein|nr:hypothetical protein [Cellulomonadaceae bacterium]
MTTAVESRTHAETLTRQGAESLTHQCAEALIQAIYATASLTEALAAAWEAEVWIPLGFPSAEEFAMSRLARAGDHCDLTVRTQVFMALASSGVIPPSALAHALNVPASTISAGMKPLKEAARNQRIREAGNCTLTPRRRSMARRYLALRDAQESQGVSLKQAEAAHAMGRAQSTIHAIKEILDANPHLCQELREESCVPTP